MSQNNERFRLVIASLGISQIEMAKILGVSKTTVNSWCKDRANISGEMQKNILEHYPHISSRWLLFGEGKMEIEKGISDSFVLSNMAKEDLILLIQTLLKQIKWNDKYINELEALNSEKKRENNKQES